MAESEQDSGDRGDNDNVKTDKMFILKKWNAVAMWSWDVECDTCAICRVQVMGECSYIHTVHRLQHCLRTVRTERKCSTFVTGVHTYASPREYSHKTPGKHLIVRESRIVTIYRAF